MDPDILRLLLGGMGGGLTGVPGPDLAGGTPGMMMPPVASSMPGADMLPAPMPAPVMPSLGAALDPVPSFPGGSPPLPTIRPAGAPGPTPLAPAAGSDALLKTLRGVQMPAPPVPQKVSTPHAPTLAKIQGGGLADLLASLGIGPQQALPGLKLPSTLGQALGR